MTAPRLTGGPADGARLALAGVRAGPTYPPLPTEGPTRLLALRRLQSVIAGDTEATIDSAIAAGWHPLDHVEAVDGYRRWLLRLIEEAVDNGVKAWRVAHVDAAAGATCATCGAEVSAGRCWGCGAPS